MTESKEDFEQALRFIAGMRTALKNNVKHYSVVDGRLLATELEITDALREDGRITLDVTDRVQRTTEAEELALARAEFGAG
jgi:hypothetical protein